MQLERLRNLGIVAHIDAGKTTVSERFLFFAGVEHRIGEVDEGTTVMDWMEEERERGITITAAATTLPWRGHRLNLIDTPGHVDFTIEVERCLRVLDGAVLVIDAVAGVQAQTETVWRQMRRHRVPAVVFVNKCDRPGADFLAATASLQRRLEAPAVPVQYPLLRDGVFSGTVDLLTRRAFSYPLDPLAGGREPVEVDLPAALADEVGVLRAELLEALAEDDEQLMAAVLEEREPDAGLLEAVLRRRTLAGTLVPVLCGAALRNAGIQPLLDAVVALLPSPSDVPAVSGLDPASGAPLSRSPDGAAPLTALAFKLQSDSHGDLAFVRVYAGTLRAGDQVLNPRVQRKERVQRLVRLHANARESIEQAGPGDIVAVTGLKFTGTGDTLCALDAPIVLEALSFPEPVITMVVEPKSSADRDKLRAALSRLAREDPSFREREDEDTGQWYVSGMGELHLEIVLHRLESEFKLAVNVGQPRVAYREAPRSPSRGAGRVERTLGTKDVFGAVELEVAPRTEGAGGGGVAVEFAPGIAVPQAFRPAVAQALELAALVGPRFGYPLVGASVRVVGGESHPAKDAELGFVQAAALALRQALSEANVDLLEPVMRFDIQAPEEFTSGILADLNARRADIESVGAEDRLQTIQGTVPLAHMFGYATAVRSLSQGRASYTLRPSGFRPVPEEELAPRGLVWA
jgi:elongation factor G